MARGTGPQPRCMRRFAAVRSMRAACARESSRNSSLERQALRLLRCCESACPPGPAERSGSPACSLPPPSVLGTAPVGCTQRAMADNIVGSPRFEKVSLGPRERQLAHHSAARQPTPSPPLSQVKELGSGNFGLARLERELATGELVAIKYIPRGSTARLPPPLRPLRASELRRCAQTAHMPPPARVCTTASPPTRLARRATPVPPAPRPLLTSPRSAGGRERGPRDCVPPHDAAPQHRAVQGGAHPCRLPRAARRGWPCPSPLTPSRLRRCCSRPPTWPS